MGIHPKLDKLDYLFKAGKTFELTDAQYEKKTGRPLPKDTYYLKNKSALATKAKKAGYSIQVIEKRIICVKEETKK